MRLRASAFSAGTPATLPGSVLRVEEEVVDEEALVSEVGEEGEEASVTMAVEEDISPEGGATEAGQVFLEGGAEDDFRTTEF